MNTVEVLKQFNIDSTSVAKAVHEVRELVEGSNDPASTAHEIIKYFTVEPVKTIDPIEARIMAQYLVQQALQRGESYDPIGMLEKAQERVALMMIRWPHAFTADAPSYAPVYTKKEVEGVVVQMKDDGKLKKGGKQVIAQVLYEKNAGKSNGELIAIFMKELDMSKAGATTYVYNCKKAAGIKPGKRGRKAKGKKA